MSFLADYAVSIHPEPEAVCIIYTQGSLYLDENNQLPVYTRVNPFKPNGQTDTLIQWLKLGEWNKAPCYLYLADSRDTDFPSLVSRSLREVLKAADSELKKLLHYSYHFYQWNQDSQFCGRCGQVMSLSEKALLKNCAVCGFEQYPRVNPCMIVAIVKDNSSILLAEISRNGRSFSSVLAGYVEIGESIEECVEREVWEEVGIRIKNIEYFASQTWSFSQSLMLAFVAEYSGGEINVDGKEIQNAAWYRRDNLPALPPKFSIARELIDWFVRGNT